MANKKLYDALGVEPEASDKDIRSAYRKLAKKFHPDLNPGDKGAEEKFKEISSAFAILGDKEKREKYDAGEIDDTGAETQQQQYYRHYADTDEPHHYSTSAGFEDFVDLGEIFADAFAQRKGWQFRRGFEQAQFVGQDVRYHLPVTFVEAVTGASKRVTMPDDSVLDVKIPVGIADGQIIRLKGKGQPGINGGPNGDALISIEVMSHPIFKRDKQDIEIELPITIDEAVLGAKVRVPTISGAVDLKIPKGASSGQVMRLRGKGIKSKSRTGDQLVRLKVVLPEKVDEELESFMNDWKSKHSYNPRETLEAGL